LTAGGFPGVLTLMAARIYLAGPDVFFPNPKEVAQGHKEVLARHGLEGVFPLDNEVETSGSPVDMAQRIFELNCRLIDSCDGVLANMMPFRGPSMDVGTAWEVGYAYAQGKPIVGYTEDLADYRDKVFRSGFSESPEAVSDRAGHAIEHFEVTDNIMISQSVTAIASSIEEAAALMAERLRVR
jgi:nucleoside 2-deoxyribosyltransferase